MTDRPVPASTQPAEIAELLGRALWSAHLNGSPAAMRAREWMQEIHPGDLVVGLTGILNRNLNGRGIGTLLKIEHRRVDHNDDEKWDEVAEGRPCPTHRVYHIDTLDRGIVEWENEEFVRVPKTRDEYHELWEAKR